MPFRLLRLKSTAHFSGWLTLAKGLGVEQILKPETKTLNPTWFGTGLFFFFFGGGV